MSKTMIVVVGVIVALVVVMVIVFMMQRPSAEVTSPTLQNIKNKTNRIACDDATWLLDKNFVMIDEKLSQLDGFEQTQDSMTEEEYTEMQNVIYNTPSPAQKEIDSWYNEIILGIAALERNDPERQKEIQNAVGAEYLQIYQAAMAVRLGLMDGAAVRAALEENFCQ